jgi:spore maturation protein CgeB
VAYLYRRRWHRLSMTGEEVEQSLAAVSGAGESSRNDEAGDGQGGKSWTIGPPPSAARESDAYFVFGVGYGEPARALLDRRPSARITVWDRDPWLMRLFLMSRNFKQEILSGRLEVALCADLLDHIGRRPEPRVAVHPLLGTVYANEYRLWKHGAGARRAVLCEGELFIDDLGEALRGEGYSLFTVDPGLLSLQEMREVMDRFRPEFLASIDYRNGMAEFCRGLGVKLLCWEVNPAADRIETCAAPGEGAFIFTYKAAQVEEFRRAGYAKAAYLPLAANPQRRAPLELTAKERDLYEADLSFVGASMRPTAGRLQQVFLERFQAARPGDGGFREDVVEAMEKVLAGQRRDFSVYRIPALYEEHFGDLAGEWPAEAREDPVRLLAEVAAAEKRLDYLGALGALGVTVWGDPGWESLAERGVRYRGKARHGRQLTKIYCASRVNLDVGRLYQSDIVTMRVFDVLACGGFLLTEYNDALAELFEVGRDLEAFRTREEMCDKASFYRKHPEKARAMARQGMEKVRARHTVALRVRHMLDVMRAG